MRIMKMDKNLTHITVVLDRSGSMQSCKDDAEGGLNSFVEQQKQESGRCTFTMVEFDDQYDVLHNHVDIQTVGRYTLVPRGMTALLDAVGKAIQTTGDRIENLSEDSTPGKVIFVIVTDGCENSSKEYTRNQIKSLIKKKTDEYDWQFTFIGANQDAFAEAGSMGVRRGTTLNYNVANTQCVFTALSSNVSAYRAGDSKSIEYTSSQRISAMGGNSDA